jgi:hypothetical protein
LPKPKDGEDALNTTVVPVPLNVSVCVVPATSLLLSVTARLPVSAPDTVGAKLTLIVQEELAARLVPQLLVSVKLAVAPMLLIVSAVLPVLFKVTGCEALVVPTRWLPKGVKPAADNEATGARPVPLKLTAGMVTATPLPVPTMVKEPLAAPAPDGEKAMPIVHCVPAATAVLVLHVVVVLSTPKPAVGLMALIFKAALPVLLNVNVCAALVDPTRVLGKLSAVEERLPAAPLPVPLNARYSLPLPTPSVTTTKPV